MSFSTMLHRLCWSLWLCGSQQIVENLQEMGIPDHLTCLLWNLHGGQEATVRIEHGTTDWFQIGKGVHQGYIVKAVLSLCLFNFYAEYIMRNAGLEETQAGIKIVGRNIRRMKHICSSGLTNTMQSSIIIHIKLYFQCNIFMSSFSIIPWK